MATIRTYWGNFSTFNSVTGAQTDCDTNYPTAAAHKNGTPESHTTVNCTKVSTGLYKWTVPLDGTYWADKDECTIIITAAVLGIVETGQVAYRQVHLKAPDDVYTDMAKDATVSKPATPQTITAPADMALNSVLGNGTYGLAALKTLIDLNKAILDKLETMTQPV